jgi:hypothetical protein
LLVSEIVTQIFFGDPAPDNVPLASWIEKGVGGVQASMVKMASKVV